MYHIVIVGLEPASQSIDPVKDLIARTTLLTLMEKKMQDVRWKEYVKETFKTGIGVIQINKLYI